MSHEEDFRKALNEAKKDKEYILYSLLFDISESICKRLSELGWTRKEFANHLGVSNARITNLLNGYPNMTMKTLVDIAHTLKLKFKGEFFSNWEEPQESERKVNWNRNRNGYCLSVMIGGESNNENERAS
jgi:transcriptional regulator with XRE-family HTH domain